MAKKKASPQNASGMSESDIVSAAVELGAKEARIVAARKVVTGHWVRWKCCYGCTGYQSSLMCPPFTPQPAQTREMLDEYKRGVLFEAGRGKPKKIAVALEKRLFLQGFYKAFGLGAGPCNLCDSCSFEEGCRNPEIARPSLEAVGIDVFATARLHGFTINVVRNRNDSQHYFGLVLID